MMFLSKQLHPVAAGIAATYCLCLTACSPKESVRPDIIPLPAQLVVSDGFLSVDSVAVFSKDKPANVRFEVDPSIGGNPEGYRLTISDKGIDLKASTETGIFYGEQTIRQLFTPKGLPYVSIQDEPRLKYRGMHLDVSRHFFPKEEVFKLLDVMSYYKLNNLHMHLTDAGGWRLQIDKYPKLTTETAYRNESDWKEWWGSKDHRYLPEGTEGAYGGYYTKEDMREIVAYAATKHINVVPEIEFPGHSNEVLFAYPELSCTGQPYKHGDFCIGNPKTIDFMEDVLDEVVELFPSEYIHVGGDEAGKSSWKTCPKCQALMKKMGMENVDELQSYMIHKAEEHLIAKGRKLIGWDEILEGGLAPEATVMSWRGENGGIKAARMGHDVVMTPSAYMYFDFYQADPKTQPFAIGGYTPIRRVYSYNPVPVDSLTEEEGRHIVGVQANTWTEFIADEKYLEYMMFPRALAVAEIGWTPQDKREWSDFKPRMNAHIPVLQRMGINAFTLSDELDIALSVDTIKKQIKVCIDAEKCPVEIRYTTDGTEPTASSACYKGAITVKDSAYIKAAIFRDGKMQGTPSEKKVDYHRAINKPIHYNSKLYGGYMAGGMNALLDGYRGGLTYLDGLWQGYINDLDCVIDMEELTDIHKVSARFMQLIGPGVYQPVTVELLTSENGTDFTSRGVIPTTKSNKDPDLSFQEYVFRGDWKARYIQLKADEANNGFIFLDEIVVW